MELTRYQKYKASYQAYEQANKDRFKECRKRAQEKRRYGATRAEILERLGDKCLECGMTNYEHQIEFGRAITIHHRDGQGRYHDGPPNNHPENHEVLCLRCHGRKDRIRGYMEEKP